MPNLSNPELLARAANRARDRSFFVASVLMQYERERNMSQEDLALQLGCTIATLDTLALCRRPETWAELEQIAQYTEIGIEKLATILSL